MVLGRGRVGGVCWGGYPRYYILQRVVVGEG